MKHEVDLTEYLFTRLAQIGVRSIHGVPGDYNLTILDYVEPAGLHWVGNANELNAGYAADGYARIKGCAALITSFGVGELSAINAIGASYSEKAPVVHIVGTPPLAAQNAGACLHHSLGDGNFRAYANMYRVLTVAQVNITDAKTASSLIDMALKECLLQSRPVYIEIPTDTVKIKVSAPVSLIDLATPGYSGNFEDERVDKVLAKIYGARQPLILVDGFTARFNVRAEVNELVRVTGFPTLTTPFGKSLVSEEHFNFHGVYHGSVGKPIHKVWVDSCDLVLRFGPLDSDVNTFGFAALPNPQITVTFEKHSVEIGTTLEPSSGDGYLHIKSTLRKLLARLDKSKIPKPQPYPENPADARNMLKYLLPAENDSVIDQRTFWLRMSKFFQPGDILLTETGTSSYGGQSFVLPNDTVVINSSIWLSIGYMLGACQGAALAQREMIKEGTRRHGRTILFEGDGSLQMSAQAISDIIRNRLDVTIFVLNNYGYTIERMIHGFHAPYNDIQPWRNLEAPSYFGAPKNDASYHVRTMRADTWGELNKILHDQEIQEGKGLTMIEIIMKADDAPESLRKFGEYLERRNGAQSHQ